MLFMLLYLPRKFFYQKRKEGAHAPPCLPTVQDITAQAPFLGSYPGKHPLASGAAEWDFSISFQNSVNKVSCLKHPESTLQVLASQLFPVRSVFSYYINSRRYTQRVQKVSKEMKNFSAHASSSPPMFPGIWAQARCLGSHPGKHLLASVAVECNIPFFFNSLYNKTFFPHPEPILQETAAGCMQTREYNLLQ